MKSFLSSVLTLILMYLFFRYIIVFCLIWALIEVVVQALKHKKVNIVVNFICNFVSTVLVSTNYIINVLLCVPANRILITSEGDRFGNSTKSFTETLKINIVKGTTKPRGILLYKLLQSITNFGKK